MELHKIKELLENGEDTHNGYLAIKLYIHNKQTFECHFLCRVIDQVKKLSMKISEDKIKVSTLLELINSKYENYEEMSKEIDMCKISQPQQCEYIDNICDNFIKSYD